MEKEDGAVGGFLVREYWTQTYWQKNLNQTKKTHPPAWVSYLKKNEKRQGCEEKQKRKGKVTKGHWSKLGSQKNMF